MAICHLTIITRQRSKSRPPLKLPNLSYRSDNHTMAAAATAPVKVCNPVKWTVSCRIASATELPTNKPRLTTAKLVSNLVPITDLELDLLGVVTE